MTRYCYSRSSGEVYECGLSTGHLIGIIVAVICVKLLLWAFYFRRRQLRKQQDIEDAVNAALANNAAAGLPTNPSNNNPNYPSQTVPGAIGTAPITAHEPGVVHVGGATMKVDNNGKIEKCSCGINHGGHVDVKPAKRLESPNVSTITAAGTSATSLPPAYTRTEPLPPTPSQNVDGTRNAGL